MDNEFTQACSHEKISLCKPSNPHPKGKPTSGVVGH